MNNASLSRDSGFMFGVGAGIWSAGTSQYAYLVGHNEVVNQGYYLLGVDLIVLGLLLFLANRHRLRYQKGHLSFADSVATGMKFFFTAGLITVIVNYFTFEVIEPNYAQQYAREATQASIEDFRELLKKDQLQDKESQQSLREQIKNLQEDPFYGARKSFVHITLWIGLGLLASLFMGALMRTERGKPAVTQAKPDEPDQQTPGQQSGPNA